MIWLALLYLMVGSAIGAGIARAHNAPDLCRTCAVMTALLMAVIWPWVLIVSWTQTWMERAE